MSKKDKNIGMPIAILCELTHRCPLQCPYCSNPVDLEKKSGEMTTEQWIDLLQQAYKMGILQVHFSGGEPAVRKDLEQLVEVAEEIGLYSNLITSGVLLDDKRIKHLAELGLKHVQISIQDSEEVSANRIGGYHDGYAQKLRAAKAVKENNMSLTMNAPIHKMNIHNLSSIIDLAVEMRASRVEVAHVQYYGWAYHNRAALMPKREQLEEATKIVEEARKRLEGILVIDYVVPDYYAKRPKACMGGWGRQFLNATPSGKIMPCHAAESITALQFDNIKDRSLMDIWQNSEAFEMYRGTDWMPKTCKSCPRMEIDWGGCRCQAFAITGKAANMDPACEFSEHHQDLLDIATTESNKQGSSFDYRRISRIPIKILNAGA